MRTPLIVFGSVVSRWLRFLFLRLRLLPGNTGHRSRWKINDTRGHKQNLDNQETIRPAPD